MLDTANYTPRLKATFADDIKAKLREEFGYKNDMQIPRLDKIVLNIGAGAEAGKDDFAAAREALEPLAEKNGSRALYDLHVPLVQDRAGNTQAAVESYRRVADGQTGPTLRLVQLLGSL